MRNARLVEAEGEAPPDSGWAAGANGFGQELEANS